MAGEIPRRRFFKAALAAVVVGAPSLLAACGSGKRGVLFPTASTSSSSGSVFSTASSGSIGGTGGEPNVFRISARHVRHPCNACVAHARNRYYKSADAAAADLAHKGCRCEVRGQAIPESQLASMFTGSQSVFDKRTA